MYRITTILVLSMISWTCLSQPQNDIIVKHNGEKLNAKITAVDDKITFTYPGETVINTLSKNCVKEIIFSSGRIQECTTKIIILGEDDWEKVIFTSNPEDVKCLVRKGEVSASASNSWNFKSKDGVDKKASMKIKKEAAVMKAHIILLLDQHKEGETLLTGSSSSKSGIAYGYE